MRAKTHCLNLTKIDCHVDIKSFDFIEVELPENATSGYRWQLEPHIRFSGLKLVSQCFNKPYDKAIGSRNFIFQVTDENIQSSVQFRLSRIFGYKRFALQLVNLDVAHSPWPNRREAIIRRIEDKSNRISYVT